MKIEVDAKNIKIVINFIAHHVMMSLTTKTYLIILPLQQYHLHQIIDINISLKAKDFDVKEDLFPGFLLLKMRVRNTLKEKGQKKVNDYITYNKDRGRIDQSSFPEKKPFRPTQICKKCQPLWDLTSSNLINR